MHDQVTVAMKATPEVVWSLVSDVTRIGEFSPETLGAKWAGGATGPALGAVFRGHVKRNEIGPVYWTTCKVIECEPGSSFGFAVMMRDQPVNTWRYRIEPTATGCDVTESFELTRAPVLRLYWRIFGTLRNRRNVRGMQQTLERIRDVVEAK